MNEPDSDGALEALLQKRELPALADDGFTQRVINCLPAAPSAIVPVRTPARSRVTLWIGAAATLVTILVFANSGATIATASAELNIEPLLKFSGQLLSNQSLWMALAMITAALATLYYFDSTQSEE